MDGAATGAGGETVALASAGDDRSPAPSGYSAARFAGRRAAVRARLSAAPSWLGVSIALALLVAVLSIKTDLFLTGVNLRNLLEGMSATLVVAIGTTLLIALGIADLSVGALMALSMMVLAGLMHGTLPVAVVLVATVAFASAVSALTTGVLVAWVRLNFFVVTLGALAAFQAAAQLPTQGATVSIADRHGFSTVEWIGSGTLLGLPTAPLIALAVVVFGGLLLNRTTFGQAARAIGGNETAARLAGIPVTRVKLLIFGLNGVAIGLAAVMFAGRSYSADPTIGASLALDVIAAVVLGGSSFIGGQATVVGTLLGVLFIAVLQNGLNLLGVSDLWQGVVTGIVLIVAVWFDRLRGTS